MNNPNYRPAGPGGPMGGGMPGGPGGQGGPRPMGNPAGGMGGQPFRPPQGGMPPGANNTGSLFGDDPLKSQPVKK